MQPSRPIEPQLLHPGTGRLAAVLRVESFWDTSPVELAAGKYILFVASRRAAALSSVEVARAWLDNGASYICAWGPTSPEVEETFDYASFLPELGEPLSFTLMTTSHEGESLEEALWFAFYNAIAPNDLKYQLSTVIIVVDSPALESACVAWVSENAE